MIAGPISWSALTLALWPLWLAYAVIILVALSNWWATR